MLLFAVHLALISRANTITWDEPDHIYSGYMSWHGDFGLNPEHPPLVKFVATVPLLPMQLNVQSCKIVLTGCRRFLVEEISSFTTTPTRCCFARRWRPQSSRCCCW